MTGGRRTGWSAVTVAAVLVFLFFGAGTTYSLLAPDYVFADGELPGEAAVLAGSLALAAFGAHRLQAPDRRLRDGVPGFGAWLPAPDAAEIDPDTPTARLRRTARRAAAIAVAWAVLFAGGLAGVIAADRAAADLLATGVRVDGSVIAVHDRFRGPSWIRVRYDAPGASRVAEIDHGSGHVYHVGEPVTVVYDPADPAHVRTTAEANENGVLVGFGVAFLVAGFAGLPFAAKAAAGWRRRVRAVAATGWRSATVTVGPRVPRRQKAEARYRDGSGVVLRCALSVHGFGAPARRPAWIGGWGRQMVVSFADDGPHHVPVSATGPRVQPISPVR